MIDLCDVLGIEMTEERHRALSDMDLTTLTRLRETLKHRRQWPG